MKDVKSGGGGEAGNERVRIAATLASSAGWSSQLLTQAACNVQLNNT